MVALSYLLCKLAFAFRPFALFTPEVQLPWLLQLPTPSLLTLWVMPNGLLTVTEVVGLFMNRTCEISQLPHFSMGVSDI